MEKIIAHLGLPGSYSHQAALRYFGKKAVVLSCPSFDEIISKIKDGTASYGVIPVSNSLTGPIADNYQLIRASTLAVVGELDLPIHHCLASVSYALQGETKKIYSHPQALSQCKKYLSKYPEVDQISYADTASAAKYVSGQKDPSLAVICSKSAAKIYSLKVLAPNIEDQSSNSTHFYVMGKPKLSQYRTQIDSIDKQIIKLISKRLSICKEVGNIKKHLKLPILDSTREQLVIKKVQSYSNLDKSFVKKLYSVIISHCRIVQYGKEV